MKEIFLFLTLIKKLAIFGIEKQLRIVLVMGNTTADLDSTISACVLAYLKNIQIGALSNEMQINPSAKEIYLPVVNCKRGTLFHRFDIEFLFKTLSIDEADLLYSSQIELGSYENHVIVNNENFMFSNPSLILVDHHELDKKQSQLSQFVTEIYDHHADQNFNYKIYPQLKEKVVLFPRCSALSVILEVYAKQNGTMTSLLEKISFFSKLENTFDFLLAPLIVDSNSFKKKTKDFRWVQVDYELATEIGLLFPTTIIENKVADQSTIKDIWKSIQKKLKKAKKDTSNNLKLGLDSLLRKDMKIYVIESKNISVSFSSIPISFESITSIYKLSEIEENFRLISQQEGVDVVMAKMDYGEECLYYINFISPTSPLHQIPNFSEGFVKHINSSFSEFKAVTATIQLTDSLFAYEANVALSRKIYWPLYRKYIEEL